MKPNSEDKKEENQDILQSNLTNYITVKIYVVNANLGEGKE